jgi:hypothetical protein
VAFSPTGAQPLIETIVAQAISIVGYFIIFGSRLIRAL